MLTSAPAGGPVLDGLLAAWTPDPLGIALATLLTAAYGLGLRRVHRRGLPWPVGRTAAWVAGTLCLLVVTAGGTGRYAGLLLAADALQLLVLLLLAPVLLAFGRPVALALDALPHRAAQRTAAVVGSAGVRAVGNPLLGPLVVPVVLGAVFFTPLLEWSLLDPWVGTGLRVGLMLLGFVLALGLVGDGTERESSAALGLAVAVGVAELLLDAVPGIVLNLQSQLLAPASWIGLHRAFGPSPLVDQQHAGALLWGVAELADLPFLVIVFRRWLRADAREAVLLDRQLDARPVPVDAAGASRLERPWWESDPERLGGHRVGREHRPPAG